MVDLIAGGTLARPAFWLTPKVQVVGDRSMQATTYDGGKTFPKQELGSDPYAQLDAMVACMSGADEESGTCDDGLFTIYFVQSTDGLALLLEEHAMHVHTLAMAYATSDIADQIDFHSSARSQVWRFQWYLIRYLLIAQNDHPDVFTAIVDSPCNVNAMLTMWDRANFYLDATDGMPAFANELRDRVEASLKASPELVDMVLELRERDRGCEPVDWPAMDLAALQGNVSVTPDE